jgi:hypothetical protein
VAPLINRCHTVSTLINHSRITVGCITARYRRILFGAKHPVTGTLEVSAAWFEMHRVIQTIGATETISFAMVAVAMVTVNKNGPTFQPDTHSVLGVCLALLVGCQVLLGFVSQKVLE